MTLNVGQHVRWDHAGGWCGGVVIACGAHRMVRVEAEDGRLVYLPTEFLELCERPLDSSEVVAILPE